MKVYNVIEISEYDFSIETSVQTFSNETKAREYYNKQVNEALSQFDDSINANEVEDFEEGTNIYYDNGDCFEIGEAGYFAQNSISIKIIENEVE